MGASQLAVACTVKSSSMPARRRLKIFPMFRPECCGLLCPEEDEEDQTILVEMWAVKLKPAIEEKVKLWQLYASLEQFLPAESS